MNIKPKGVFAAALTPLKPDGSLDLDGVLPYLDFLAKRGCHGALLFGTTGEGPSFSTRQRLILGKVALEITQTHPDFLLLMGTGTPSLDETIQLTRGAFEIGIPGVVVLPPYFHRKVSDEGLFTWFSQILHEAVPQDRFLLGYHIPQISGVPLPLSLIDRLKTAFPDRFLGIKNSWTDPEYAQSIGDHFGSDLVVFSGFDNHFHTTLSLQGSGCITASATLISPLLRRIYDAFNNGQDCSTDQAELNRIREVMDVYAPAVPLVKGLLARWHNFPLWNVCPPLTPMKPEVLAAAADALQGPF
jgi:4-hydroxy-tetrahydrodipicolinate synthase